MLAPRLRSRAAATPGAGRSAGSGQRRGPARRLATWALFALPLALGGCQVPTFWGYRGSTTQAHDEFNLYVGTIFAGIVVGGIVLVLILWAAFRYRRRNDEIPRQTQYHVPLEITYTVIPVIIVLVLFGFTFTTENAVDHISGKPDVHVKVTAFQWGWRFDYTDKHVYVLGVQRQDPDPVGLDGSLNSCTTTAQNVDDCLGPGLVLPEGQTTEINLVSNDVVHDFYVPAFNFQRDAYPGVDRQLFDLTPKHTGIFHAQCNELCGLYHSQMYFHVVVLPPAQFQAWLASGQAVPDNQPAPTTGIGANNSLQPAYPVGAGSGNVQYPSPSENQPTGIAPTTTTTAPTGAFGTGGTPAQNAASTPNSGYGTPTTTSTTAASGQNG